METKHTQTRGLVLRECRVVLQYITKTLCFMQDSQQGGQLDGICGTSRTSIKSLNPNSLGMSWRSTSASSSCPKHKVVPGNPQGQTFKVSG